MSSGSFVLSIVRYLPQLILVFTAFSCACGALAASTRIRPRIGVLIRDNSLSSVGCIARSYIDRHNLAGKLDITLTNASTNGINAFALADSMAKGKYDLVVSDEFSQQAIVTSKVMNEAKIPYLVGLASTPAVTDNRPYSLRYVPDSRQYVEAYVNFAGQVHKAKSLAIVTNMSETFSTTYSDLFIDLMKRKFPATKLTQYKILSGDASTGATFETVAGSGADLVYAPIYPFEGNKLLVTLARLNRTVPILAHVSIISSNLVPLNAPPIFFNGGVDPEAPAELRKELDSLLVGPCKLGNDEAKFDLFSNAGIIDLLRLVATVFERDPGLRGLALVEKLNATPMDGLLGKRRLSKTKLVVMPTFFYQLRGHKVEFYRAMDGVP